MGHFILEIKSFGGYHHGISKASTPSKQARNHGFSYNHVLNGLTRLNGTQET